MKWKKITETKDFLSFERKKNNLTIRIEARFEDDSWKIYKTHFDNKKLRYVQEYKAKDKKRLNSLLNQLKEEKDLNKSKIVELNKEISKDVKIKLQRIFKEYEFEKWKFSVNNDDLENVIFLHFTEKVHVDIILHHDYMHLKKNIVKDISKILGVDTFDREIKIYFFNYSLEEKEKNKKQNLLIGKIELGMEAENEKD